MKIFSIIKQSVFPNVCAACKAIIEEDEFLCDYCFNMLNQSGKDRLCIKCGYKNSECICKFRTFYFDACVSPFYNNSTARKTMYRFKFSRQKRIARFFAERMALCVKQYYFGLKFDCVTFVPMPKAQSLKRGYNQSEVLAREIAKLLDLPVNENLLYCNKKHSPQHKLGFKERFNNVKDVYFCKSKPFRMNILLVDDIKTTGATLSECAKQLLKAGADRVYCVTGLMTEPKKTKKKLTKGKKNGN